MVLLPPPPIPLQALIAAIAFVALTEIVFALLRWGEAKDADLDEARRRAEREARRSRLLEAGILDERRRRMELAEENSRLRRALPGFKPRNDGAKKGARR